MVGRNVLLLALLLSSALAGCLGDDEGTESLDAAPDGETGRGGAGEAKAGSTADAEAPQSVAGAVDEPFSWDGSLGDLALACVPSFCYGATGGTWDQSMELDGLTAAGLTMTWDAPTAPELAFGLASSCDGPCDFVAYDMGASPLTIDAGGLDPEHTYTLVAWHPYRCEPATCSVGVQAGAEAPFSIEGMVTKVA